MNKETLEHISSLMDGEISRETALFLTRRLCADEELSGTWERYHLIRDCIRQPGGRVPHVDLSMRVQAALSAEQAPPAKAWSSNRWLKPLAGVAMAASVALMAIIAIGPGQQVPGEGSPVAQPFSSPNILPASPVTQAASFSGQQDSDARLNSYLLRHNQLIGSVSSQGFIGFVPIISSDETENSEDTAPGSEEPVAATEQVISSE